MRWFRILVGLSLVVCLLPIGSVILAGIIASTYGCRLHEGFVNPCVVAGYDLGVTLYTMAVAGWFGLMTLPFVLPILIFWVLVEIANRVMRRRSTSG